MSPKAVPFKRSLLLNLTAGVAILGAMMLGISLFATQQTVARLSGMLTDQVIATTDARIMGFFEPIFAEIEIAAQRTKDGKFEDFPFAALDAYFEPLVAELPQVSSIMYAHGNGDEYMLWQRADAWYSRLSQPESRGNIAAVREWRSGEDDRSVEEQVFEYDPRVRPWFTGALASLEQLGGDAPLRERIFWTPPYRFYTSDEPGITASLAQRSSTGQLVILGFDVLLADISRYTAQLKIGEHGRVFVLRGSPEKPDSLAIIGLPADDRFDNHESMLEFVLSPPDDFGGPVASFVGTAVETEGGYAREALQFSYDGEAWWGEIAPSQLRASHDIWVGAVVPEQELLAGLPDTSLIVLIVTAIVLLLAIQRAYRLSDRYAEPLEALTEQANRMQRLNFEPGDGVRSDITEIRHLSATLERMRSALQSFTAEREDIRIAKSIRQMNLPASVPSPPGIDMNLWQEPAEAIGGESYDAVVVERSMDGHPAVVVLAVFDFAAKGLAAAIGGAELRAEFRAAIATGAADLALVAARLDQFVRDERPEICPLHTCLLRIDGDRRLEMLNFGWDEPALARGSEVQRIGHPANPLGIAPGLEPGSPLRVRLQAGDTFALASDGVLDALTVERTRYGRDGLEQALRRNIGSDSGAFIESVIADLQEYSAGVRDDRTLLVIRVPRDIR